MTNYFTYTNNNDGLEAIIATGNDRHDYRVIMNDIELRKQCRCFLWTASSQRIKQRKNSHTANQSHNT